MTTETSSNPANGLGVAGAADGMTGQQFGEFLKVMRAALKPRFDAQDKEWAEHGPGALARAAELRIKLDNYGGNCPVQIEGEFDGLAFYFRARGMAWQFHAAAHYGDIFDNDLFCIDRDYGTGPFDAGWMPLHEAIGFVCDAVTEYRSTTPEPRA